MNHPAFSREELCLVARTSDAGSAPRSGFARAVALVSGSVVLAIASCSPGGAGGLVDGGAGDAGTAPIVWDNGTPAEHKAACAMNTEGVYCDGLDACINKKCPYWCDDRGPTLSIPCFPGPPDEQQKSLYGCAGHNIYDLCTLYIAGEGGGPIPPVDSGASCDGSYLVTNPMTAGCKAGCYAEAGSSTLVVQNGAIVGAPAGLGLALDASTCTIVYDRPAVCSTSKLDLRNLTCTRSESCADTAACSCTYPVPCVIAKQ